MVQEIEQKVLCEPDRGQDVINNARTLNLNIARGVMEEDSHTRRDNCGTIEACKSDFEDIIEIKSIQILSRMAWVEHANDIIYSY